MKARRQAEILAIIQEYDIETQDQLLEKLREKGMKSTQATISRDIKELHLVKELTGRSTYKSVSYTHLGGNRHTASAGALSGASRPLRRRGSFQSAVAAENDKSMRSGVCGTAVFHRQCHGGSHPHLAHTQ